MEDFGMKKKFLKPQIILRIWRMLWLNSKKSESMSQTLSFSFKKKKSYRKYLSTEIDDLERYVLQTRENVLKRCQNLVDAYRTQIQLIDPLVRKINALQSEVDFKISFLKQNMEKYLRSFSINRQEAIFSEIFDDEEPLNSKTMMKKLSLRGYCFSFVPQKHSSITPKKSCFDPYFTFFDNKYIMELLKKVKTRKEMTSLYFKKAVKIESFQSFQRAGTKKKTYQTNQTKFPRVNRVINFLVHETLDSNDPLRSTKSKKS